MREPHPRVQYESVDGTPQTRLISSQYERADRSLHVVIEHNFMIEPGAVSIARPSPAISGALDILSGWSANTPETQNRCPTPQCGALTSIATCKVQWHYANCQRLREATWACPVSKA